MLVTARIRPPDRTVEVADARQVGDLLRRLEVKPSTVLVIRDGTLLTEADELHDGDQVEVRYAISGGGSGGPEQMRVPRSTGGSGGPEQVRVPRSTGGSGGPEQMRVPGSTGGAR